VADQVGLLKGSLYYHIHGKEELLLDVVLEAVSVLQEGLAKVMEDVQAEPKEKLRKAILSHMQAFETKYEEVSVFLNEIGNFPQSVEGNIKEAVQNYEQMWREILKEGIKEGQFRKDINLRLVLNAIFGMCNWTHKWYNTQGGLTPWEIGVYYADIVLRGIETKE